MRQWAPTRRSLTDLPEELLTSILTYLPLKAKCQAQAVCQTFKDILSKPSRGSFVWDLIHVDDPLLEAASPSELARWLIQRANGIWALQYATGSSLAHPASKLAREYQIVADVLPQLPALLSPASEIHLDLRSDSAERFLGSEDLLLTTSPGAQVVHPHWGNLARSLTRLQLSFDHEIGHATASALNELTRLERLTLIGVKSTAGIYPRAQIELCLPELEQLIVGSFSHVSILLDCPFLDILGLIGLCPLQALQGLPQDIGKVALTRLGEGSVSPQEIFGGQKLEYVRLLNIVGWGRIYQDSEALEVVKQVFRNGRLLSLISDYPLEKLTALHGPQYALPISLRVLELHLPLERGLPVVLEQLTNLRKLTVHHIGEGPMHLDRSLDPFLNMAGFKRLIFSGEYMRQGATSLDFTPNASRFLDLASKRIEEGGLLPRCRNVVLQAGLMTDLADWVLC